MSPHWTYDSTADPDNPLGQGDILLRSPELDLILDEIHPHFRDPKYLGFMVITQSCDLILRGKGGCKAEYINLAVIRDLDTVLEKFLDTVCQKVGRRIYLKRSRQSAQQLLDRLLNQNEQALGLFYLHPDADTIGIAEESVVLLRVSVTFKSEHYDVLRESRRGRLEPEFRNKLGWIVGNLYSRIGTPDWNETPGGDKEFRELRNKLLSDEKYDWVTQASLDALRETMPQPDSLPRDELLLKLKECEPAPFSAQLQDEVQTQLQKILSSKSEALSTFIESWADNDEESILALKSMLATSISTKFDIDEKEGRAFIEEENIIEHILSSLSGHVVRMTERLDEELTQKLTSRLGNSRVFSKARDRKDRDS